MNPIIKNIFIIVVLIVLIFAFSSSYTSLSIDNLAFVVAIGIDSSSNNKYKITFQFVNVSSLSENGTTDQSPTIVHSVEASSIGTAINLMDTFIERELNLSHCKQVVISEEVASRGISKEIYTLMNDIQLRASTNIIISKCDANYYIKNSSPNLENLITQYYEKLPDASNYTGYSMNASLGKFFNSLVSNTCEPVAILRKYFFFISKYIFSF